MNIFWSKEQKTATVYKMFICSKRKWQTMHSRINFPHNFREQWPYRLRKEPQTGYQLCLLLSMDLLCTKEVFWDAFSVVWLTSILIISLLHLHLRSRQFSIYTPERATKYHCWSSSEVCHSDGNYNITEQLHRWANQGDSGHLATENVRGNM